MLSQLSKYDRLQFVARWCKQQGQPASILKRWLLRSSLAYLCGAASASRPGGCCSIRAVLRGSLCTAGLTAEGGAAKGGEITSECLVLGTRVADACFR